MRQETEGARLAYAFGTVFRWVLISTVLFAIMLFCGSFVCPAEPISLALREIALILAGAVIVMVIQQIILGDYFRRQSVDTITEAISPRLDALTAKMTEDMSQIVPQVKRETVAAIEDIRDRVAEAAEFMLTGIGVLSGAKKAGLVNIFPTRYEKIQGESVVDAITNDMQAENSSIRLMGISLGDYFLDRGVLHKGFIDLLTRRTNSPLRIRALLVHPKCAALKERARWEAGQEYYTEPAFYDSTTFIETEGAARISRRLCDRYPSILAVRLYSQAPTAFVLLTSRFAFIEHYHYGARGSNVPVLQVQAGAPLYEFYESHFERIWEVSQSIKEYDSFLASRDG
jgi:hypothetical protein